MKLKSMAAAVALAAAALAGGTSNAATIAGQIKTTDGNDALGPLSLPAVLDGYFGASLWLVASGQVTISATILGSEAAYKNSFTFGSTTYTSPGVYPAWSPAGSAPSDVGQSLSWSELVSPGLLSFLFKTNSGAGSVANGSNPDNSVAGPNFFVSFVHDPTATSGQAVYLFLDDGANEKTDNHDDLVLKLAIENGSFSAVPLPATGILLLGALGGLGALRRRKTA